VLAATSTAGQNPSRLFFVCDHSNRLRFLVDTGAEVSVMAPTRTDWKNRQQTSASSAVNHMNIATSLKLNLGLHHAFRWVFTIADVQPPILGADFLHHLGLLIDVRQRKLTDSVTNLHVFGL
jgi:predicted aspartyl protease